MDDSLNATIVLTNADITQVFDWHAAIKALELAYSTPGNEANFPPRSMARGDRVWLRTLSGAFADGSIMGSKQISASIKEKKASYLISLFDQTSSQLLCLMDAQSITGYRTAATSALALKHLLPHKIGKIAVIGSGYEAKTHIRALAALLPIEQVEVYSPRAESRQKFIEDLSDLNLKLSAASTAEAAILGAEVVICAARSKDETPTLKGEWLQAGMTIVSVGSTLPEQREVDEIVIQKAALIVADMPEEVAHDTGDMLHAKKTGVKFSRKLVSLSDLVQQKARRKKPSDIVLYKSVGAAIQDLAVAKMCYHRAVSQNLGISLGHAIPFVSK
jgi:alanine dehydrogenase